MADARFVAEMKGGGFVAAALRCHGIEGASVAPTEAWRPRLAVKTVFRACT